MPGPPMATALDSVDNSNSVNSETKQLDLRDYFPETWLWDLHHIG